MSFTTGADLETLAFYREPPPGATQGSLVDCKTRRAARKFRKTVVDRIEPGPVLGEDMTFRDKLRWVINGTRQDRDIRQVLPFPKQGRSTG